MATGAATGAGAAVLVAAGATIPPRGGRGDPIDVIIWVGALILAVTAAGLIVMAIRKHLLSRENQSNQAGGMLDQLRTMHARGEVSDAEFQAARASLLAKATGVPIPKPETPPDPSVRRARPGYDLTGAPLPPLSAGGNPHPDEGSEQGPHAERNTEPEADEPPTPRDDAAQ
ncbi:MAG: SHOCT domain-containing protein [Phycisphaerales bacterium]